MISAFIYFCIVGAGYVLLVIVHPVHRCPRCRGGRVIPGRGRCPTCKGAGKTVRLGAGVVHRLLHDHLGPAIRDWIRPVLPEDPAERQGTSEPREETRGR